MAAAQIPLDYALTNDILDTTRIESNLLQLNKAEFDLNDLILNVIRDYKNQVNNSNKDIKLVFENGSQNTHSKTNKIITIIGDKYRLHQVISNLIANSIKFIPPEGGVIYVSLEEEWNKTILVSVEDTSLGIDSEILPKLF